MSKFICRICGHDVYSSRYDLYTCEGCSTTFTDPTLYSLPPVLFKRLTDDAVMPVRAKEGDVGYDACSVVDVVLNPMEVVMVETGISVELPLHTEMQVRARSGMAKKYGIMVVNAPGTIDSGYRGPCNVLLINTDKEAYRISKGDKIAQFLITTKLPYKFVEVKNLGSTDRGDGGFGHTGK